MAMSALFRISKARMVKHKVSNNQEYLKISTNVLRGKPNVGI
jgi:hypothetical protein